MIGIICAMDIELNNLLKNLSNKKVVSINSKVFYKGFILDKEVVLSISGIGKVNSALTSYIMVNNFNVSQVINSGICGGMKNLRKKDIIISKYTYQADFDISAITNYKIGEIPNMPYPFFSDKILLNKIKEKLNFIEATILSSDKFITKIDNNFYQIDDFIACDMESASINQVCNMLNIPFFSIRVVSDIIGNKNQEQDYNETESFYSDISSNTLLKLLTIL